MKQRLGKALLALISIVALIAFGITLENVTGFPFDTTYRIACAAICLFFMARMAWDYPGQRWPWIALLVAATINAGFFLTPIFDHPASRGEIMIFALPDVTIFFMARAITYPASGSHERAVRQQLIVGAILGAALSALILATTFIPDRKSPQTIHHTQARET